MVQMVYIILQWLIFIQHYFWNIIMLRHLVFYFISFHFILFYFFAFLGLHLPHMEVPRLGVQSELLPPAYTTATATWDPNHVCDLHDSSWQCWILNPVSKARYRFCVLMDTSQIHFCWATMAPPWKLLLLLTLHCNIWHTSCYVLFAEGPVRALESSVLSTSTSPGLSQGTHLWEEWLFSSCCHEFTLQNVPSGVTRTTLPF